jgi:hypothetical protein
VLLLCLARVKSHTHIITTHTTSLNTPPPPHTLQAVYKVAGKVLPDDPWEQLRMGVDAVFR